MAIQWLKLCTSSVRAVGLIPGWGTKISHATKHGQKRKKNKKGVRLQLKLLFLKVQLKSRVPKLNQLKGILITLVDMQKPPKGLKILK